MSIPLIVLAVIGLLIYALAEGKASEIGRMVFFCAFLAICFGGSAGHWLRLTT